MLKRLVPAHKPDIEEWAAIGKQMPGRGGKSCRKRCALTLVVKAAVASKVSCNRTQNTLQARIGCGPNVPYTIYHIPLPYCCT